MTKLPETMTPDQAINGEWRTHWINLDKKYQSALESIKIFQSEQLRLNVIITSKDAEIFDLRKQLGLDTWIN